MFSMNVGQATNHTPIKKLTEPTEAPNTLNTPAKAEAEVEEFKSCTVTYKVKLEDGTKIEHEITFDDLSWWQCSKVKVLLFLDKIF